MTAEGWPSNAKRVSRLYNDEGLSIRPKTPRDGAVGFPLGDTG